MSRTKDDAADAVHQELVAAFGEDWSIDDFPADGVTWYGPRPDRAWPVAVEVGPGPLDAAEQVQLAVTQTFELTLPLEALQKLQERAKASGVSVNALVSEWVTAEASAEDTIPRDELLAVLARQHPRSA
ncbi:hypothetical protein [Nocardia salmonicida]|uniref:hypothetical protein n=1 Tax=Nocardia salmonicida TaxID=53431 RepID=UPI0037A5275D